MGNLYFDQNYDFASTFFISWAFPRIISMQNFIPKSKPL